MRLSLFVLGSVAVSNTVAISTAVAINAAPVSLEWYGAAW